MKVNEQLLMLNTLNSIVPNIINIIPNKNNQNDKDALLTILAITDNIKENIFKAFYLEQDNPNNILLDQILGTAIFNAIFNLNNDNITNELLINIIMDSINNYIILNH